MVMADRPEVETASPPIAAIDMVGLAQSMGTALLRVPFRSPWRGAGDIARNVGVSVTRELMRSFLGYATSLPVDEFRSVEKVVDTIAGAVLPPWVRAEGVTMRRDVVGGVPGLWFRPPERTPALEMLYLHGGGYIGTSPNMYALFIARLARATKCEVFVADYRLAPEFPYPAPIEDALAVLTALRDADPEHRFIVAGDSGGGGLAGSVLYECSVQGLRRPAGVMLFSPEISMVLDEPSVTENAKYDVLPWNIPTSSYLHGLDPRDVSVSGRDVTDWPPAFVAYGGDEIFRDPIRHLVERLREAGVDTDAHEQPGMFHVFPVLVPWAASSRATYARAGAFVDRIRAAQAATPSRAASAV
jgi:acetyl esterase/lipase